VENGVLVFRHAAQEEHAEARWLLHAIDPQDNDTDVFKIASDLNVREN
jgi:hypothetical protein